MSPQDMNDLLIRLDERTKSIEEKVDALINHADNGGWKRCTRQDDRIKALEDFSVGKKETEKWFKRTTIGTLLVLVTTKIWDWFPF
jgi:hypothetical protein